MQVERRRRPIQPRGTFLPRGPIPPRGPVHSRRHSSEGPVQSRRQSSQGPVQSRRQSSQGPVQSRRQSSQGPVQSRRRVRTKFSRLKYRNILCLIAGAIAIGWIVTIPFRIRRPPDPPVILAQQPVSPPTIQTSENLADRQSEPTFSYNIKTPPNPVYSQELQGIVDEAVNIATSKGLPAEPLSITLFDVSNSKTHTFAGYQNQTLRFPASVAKLFWMAAFYSAIEK